MMSQQPTSHNQTVDRTRLVLINAILTGLKFNVGEVIAWDISVACKNDKGILAFPCLIFALYRRAVVPTSPGDKYAAEKSGWMRKEYMRKMEVADATPIQMAMATPQASEQAEPEVPAGIPRSPPAQEIIPAGIPRSPAATSQATPAASHTPTPAATPATQDSKQSTPDSPLGSTPTPPPSPPPARSEDATPLHILQLRSQLQRIEATLLQHMEETKVFQNSLISLLCFQFPAATAYIHNQPTTNQLASFSTANLPKSTPVPSKGAGNTEKVDLSSDDENDIFDWHTPMEHHGPTCRTPSMEEVPGSSTIQKSPPSVPAIGTSYIKRRRSGITKFYVPLEIHVQIPKTGGRVKRLTVSSLINSKYFFRCYHILTNS
ncbi:hypothetical protein GQ457_09G019220 [Hibiscus cannabinus]